MQYFLTINGREHTLEIARGDVLACRLDGVPFEADVVTIAPGVFSMLIGGKSFNARVESAGFNSYTVQIGGAAFTVAVRDPRRWQRGSSAARSDGPQQITAPMPGKIVRILVSEQQRVEAGQGVIVVEAMKMQNEIKAPSGGLATQVKVREGQLVAAGEVLLVLQ